VKRYNELVRYDEFVMLRSPCGLIECGACVRQRRRERAVSWGGASVVGTGVAGGAGRRASVVGTGAVGGGASVGVPGAARRGGRGGLQGVGGVSVTVIGLGLTAYITHSSIALSCPRTPCSQTRRAARKLRYWCTALMLRGNRSLLLIYRSLLLIYCSKTRCCARTQGWVWRWMDFQIRYRISNPMSDFNPMSDLRVKEVSFADI
jgi:hypothetical protein